jgi:hypothetical protein
MSGLPVLFLIFDGVMKLLNVAPVRAAHDHLGYPQHLALGIGLVELAAILLYVVPRTSTLGAILLTAFLGGATAAHVRLGEPFFFPVLVGVLLWGGRFLRDERLRELVPLRGARSRA